MLPQVAAQLFTLRDYIKTPDDVLATFKRLKSMGFETVQVSTMGPIAPTRLKEICDETQMKICVTHTPIDRICDDTDAVIAEHLLWGCPYVGYSMIALEYRTFDGLKEYAKRITPVLDRLLAAGLKFVHHNHQHEFEKFEGKTMLEWLATWFPPEKMGFLLDTAWTQLGGRDPERTLRQFGDRVDILHLKDYRMVGGEHQVAELGQGNLDWAGIMQAAKDVGVKYFPIEQDLWYGRDPFDCLADSFAFIAPYFK